MPARLRIFALELAIKVIEFVCAVKFIKSREFFFFFKFQKIIKKLCYTAHTLEYSVVSNL